MKLRVLNTHFKEENMRGKILLFQFAGVLLTTTIFLNGCATIMGQGGPESLNVRSAPDQATVVITDESGTKIFEGKTPTVLSLEKYKGFFSGKKYKVGISKPGYNEQTLSINTRVNGWYLGGNLLFGGLIGWLIVDPATGAMWTLDTKEVNVTLAASQEGGIITPNKTGIVLLQDVPLSLRDKMVKVSK